MKPRIGLNRKVSSIFDGAPVPNPAALAGGGEAGSQLSSSAMRSRPGEPVHGLHKPENNEPVVDDGRKKRALIGMLILLPIFILLICYNLKLFPSQEQKPAAAVAVKAPVAEVVPAVATESVIAWSTPDAYPQNMPDPMAFGKGSDIILIADSNIPVAISLTVKGIVFSQDKPSAIINGQIVYQGQTIDGATVTKINHKSVEFAAVGKTWTQEVQR